MSRYLISVYHDESAEQQWGEAQLAADNSVFHQYMQALQKSGTLLRIIIPMPSTTATTLQVRNGKTVTVGTPFAGVKEQPFTYYLLDCKDFGEVMALAAGMPLSVNWSVEIRPVIDVEQLT
ncbi:MAG: YciI family protein [Ktedonobacteraceae bacterium]